MADIPRDPTIDAAVGILTDGYEYVWNRCKRMQTDLFRTRVLGQSAVCIHGAEAARLFYDDTKLRRHGAIPRRIVTSLFGKDAVQTLDDEPHRDRKAMLMSVMTPESLARLAEESARRWRDAIRAWEHEGAVVLFDEVQVLLTKAACAWTGVPLDDADASRRARDFVLMVDAFGGVGPRLWRGKLARQRAETWIEGIVREVRDGRLHADTQTALSVVALHEGLDGRRLPARLAAVELINLIRPTVAISWYVAFAALALHEHPGAREQLARERTGDDAGAYAERFAQEVRRYYPFTPFLGALVRSPFEWKGHRFEPGTLVVLDVYGTNRDPRLWAAPEEFRPERFERWADDAFGFIPQGGGDHATGHRCAGEWVTLHELTLALHFLARCAAYRVPAGQDLSFSLSRMPTRPKSGVVIENVRATAALEEEAPLAPSLSAARDSAAFAASRSGVPEEPPWQRPGPFAPEARG